MFAHFLQDVSYFLAYFACGAAATTVYVLIYTAVTPYKEIQLIKDQNQAAAIAFSGSLIGFMIAITTLIKNSVDLLDFGMWSVVAILIQLLAYGSVRLIFPRISERIEQGEVPASIWLASMSIAAGLLNAACMTD